MNDRSEAHNIIALVLGLNFAVALDHVLDGSLDSPAVVCSVIDGHAVAAERAGGAVLQRLVKLLVIRRCVPVHSHSVRRSHLCERTLASARSGTTEHGELQQIRALSVDQQTPAYAENIS